QQEEVVGRGARTCAASPLLFLHESPLLRTFGICPRGDPRRAGETLEKGRSNVFGTEQEDRPPRLRGALEGEPRRRGRADVARLHRTRSGQSRAPPWPRRGQ